MPHCPDCNLEYEEDASRCSDCGAVLVAGPPIEEPVVETHPDITLERVFATGDPSVIPIVKSVLEAAGIPFLAKGENVQNLIGWGTFGTRFNYLTGPVEFYVASDDAPAAREILKADPTVQVPGSASENEDSP